MKDKILKMFLSLDKDYDMTSNEVKLEMLNNIEEMVREYTPIYKYKMTKVEGHKHYYISRCGKVYNSLSKSFCKVLSKNKCSKTFKGGHKETLDLLKIYYNTFVGDIPDGWYIHSRSNSFLFDVEDLYILPITYFEKQLLEGEDFTEFKYSSNYLVTTFGRVYSKYLEEFLPIISASRSVRIDQKHYKLIDIMFEHFFNGKPLGDTKVIYKDNNPLNVQLINLRVVPSIEDYWLGGDTKWKRVIEDKYIVSDKGDIYSYFNEHWRKMKLTDKKGYSVFKPKNTHYKVHRLVYSSFVDSEIDNYEINHINRDKKDNSVSNLEKVTGKENYIHYKANCLIGEGSNISYKYLEQLYNRVNGRSYTLYSFLDNELRSQISAKDFSILKKKIVDIFKGVSG